MKLLVACDGSVYSRRALHRAVSLAPVNPTVHVATVIPRGAHTAEIVGQQRLLSEAKALATEQGLPCETHELVGDAAAELIELAGRISADMILVGTRGRGAAASVLLGSVSTKLSREAPCDVLIAR